jgi:50S ribosomal protein L16 3-hydroxylase
MEMMNATRKKQLLNGLSPQEFMQTYWQKKPLLIRQALQNFQPPIDRATLFDLACTQDVESRIVKRTEVEGAVNWSVRSGPFKRRSLPSTKRPNWTLLVQGVDLFNTEARALLDQFRFVPDARLDDLMMSYASKGGGVGPHFDSYDVFLLQAAGRRRWQIGKQKRLVLRADAPLKILEHFVPQAEYVLEPGDMLYLPPHMAHDGVSLDDECLTCSIGFQAPSVSELSQAVLARLADSIVDEVKDSIYQDPTQPATPVPGRLPLALVEFAKQAIERVLDDQHAISQALGEYLTEPKPSVWFESGSRKRVNPSQWVLDRRTRMMYDDKHIFVNGESFQASGPDGRIMRRLADQRCLGADTVNNLSPQAASLLREWLEAGWLHAHLR